jgi:hypothetical protein
VVTTRIDLIDMALPLCGEKIAFAEEIFRADRYATASLHSGNVAMSGAQFARRLRRGNSRAPECYSATPVCLLVRSVGRLFMLVTKDESHCCKRNNS